MIKRALLAGPTKFKRSSQKDGTVSGGEASWSSLKSLNADFLQEDIAELQEGSKKWLLQFNEEKCEVYHTSTTWETFQTSPTEAEKDLKPWLCYQTVPVRDKSSPVAAEGLTWQGAGFIDKLRWTACRSGLCRLWKSVIVTALLYLLCGCLLGVARMTLFLLSFAPEFIEDCLRNTLILYACFLSLSFTIKFLNCSFSACFVLLEWPCFPFSSV